MYHMQKSDALSCIPDYGSNQQQLASGNCEEARGTHWCKKAEPAVMHTVSHAGNIISFASRLYAQHIRAWSLLSQYSMLMTEAGTTDRERRNH